MDQNSTGFKHWIAQIKNGKKPEDVLSHFKSVAQKQIEKSKIQTLEEVLGNDDEGNRIAVVIPQSEIDVLFVNSLMKRFKRLYPNHNIYVFTQLEYFPFIEDSPYVYKVLQYSQGLENSFSLEGIGKNKGLFEAAFYPHATTQKFICYSHNGISKHQFPLI